MDRSDGHCQELCQESVRDCRQLAWGGAGGELDVQLAQASCLLLVSQRRELQAVADEPLADGRVAWQAAGWQPGELEVPPAGVHQQEEPRQAQ